MVTYVSHLLHFLQDVAESTSDPDTPSDHVLLKVGILLVHVKLMLENVLSTYFDVLMVNYPLQI